MEGNIAASDALRRALGVRSPKPKNWTVCHIWGYDDDAFAAQGRVVRDPRYFSCVGNMVWLPTPLKGFTDALPEIKTMLRTCAFHLYGWACEHDDARDEASRIRGGLMPAGYPGSWPTADHPDRHPPETAPFTTYVESAIQKQREKSYGLHLRPQPLLGAMPEEHKPSLAGSPADVRESQKVEGARLAEPALSMRCVRRGDCTGAIATKNGEFANTIERAPPVKCTCSSAATLCRPHQPRPTGPLSSLVGPAADASRTPRHAARDGRRASAEKTCPWASPSIAST